MSLSSWCGIFLAFVLLGTVNCAASPECKPSEERSKASSRSGAVDKKVVCSNMELQQVLPVTSFPNRTVTL
ncbi:adhesion G protein-coupled receptor A3 [Tachysurus ichikawai]